MNELMLSANSIKLSATWSVLKVTLPNHPIANRSINGDLLRCTISLDFIYYNVNLTYFSAKIESYASVRHANKLPKLIRLEVQKLNSHRLRQQRQANTFLNGLLEQASVKRTFELATTSNRVKYEWEQLSVFTLRMKPLKRVSNKALARAKSYVCISLQAVQANRYCCCHCHCHFRHSFKKVFKNIMNNSEITYRYLD